MAVMDLPIRHRLSVASFLVFAAVAFPAVESPADLRATLEAVRAERDPVRHSLEFGSGLRRWMDQDPEAALTYIRQLPRGPDYTQGLLLVLDAMGRRDPTRTLTLARALAVTREERAFYGSFFARVARDDVPSAVRLLDLVPEGEGRENAVRALADAWAPVDFAAAFAWAQGLAAPAGRSAAIESTLAALGAVDPSRT